MSRLILILGGARSGKSRFATDIAREFGGDDVLFVATAQAGDAEMARRIEIHQRTRPPRWRLLEVSRNVGTALAGTGDPAAAVLIDCLTLLVSNTLLECEGDPAKAEKRVREEVESLVASARQRSGTVIVVSGEVGQGIVPDTSLGRRFRDLLGWANQDLAREADAVYLLVAGLPVDVKSLAVPVEEAVRRLREAESDSNCQQ